MPKKKKKQINKKLNIKLVKQFSAMSSSDEKIKKILNNKWGGYGIDPNLWENLDASVIKVKKLEEFNFDRYEISGILSDRIIEACSSFLSKCPETGRYTLTKCNLSKMNLVDCSALTHHRYLQYINIAYNKIDDLFFLENMRYLNYLNASHNQIRQILNFKPPFFLTHVILSHNKIKYMKDLSDFWSIVKLDLSHNEIEKISGLQNLRYLKNLDLSYNLIETVENLDNMRIEELNLEYNCISHFITSVKTLINLKSLILAHNKITSLSFLHDTYFLRFIDLKFNKISDLLEVSHLKGQPIYEIDLRGNSCIKWPYYKDLVLFSLPSVINIDGSDVSIAEKVAAATNFDPPVDLRASQNLRKLILLEQLRCPKIDDSVIPYDQLNPLLVILSGPSAVKKIALGLKIAEKFPKKVRYCPSYTTREFSMNDKESKAYKFLEREEFNEMARNGEFATVEELVGDSYGFHNSEMGILRTEGKIGITQMDLQTSIQMKIRYPNVKLILVLVKDERIHREWIIKKFKIFTWIKDSVENLLALTIGIRSIQNIVESKKSQTNFACDLLDEIIDNLEISSYSNSLRHQGSGITAMDIISESPSLLPKITKTRCDLTEGNKKHITFYDPEKFEEPTNSQHDNLDSTDLKVMVDEEKNIIVDDEKSKKKRKQAKFLYRRKVMECTDNYEIEIESESSEESQERFFQKFRKAEDSKTLMDSYVEIVLRSRQDYIDQHLKNPGFYSLVIFSDEFESHAVQSLTHFIKNIYVKSSNLMPMTEEIKHLMDHVVPDKVERIVNMISTTLK